MVLATAFIFALILSLVLTPLGMRAAWAVGYLDHPEARKLHTKATALLGGVVVFVSALISWFIVRWLGHAEGDRQAGFLLAGAMIALLLGLWDDRFGMHPVLKLMGQAGAAGMLLVSGAVADLGLPYPVNAAITLVALIAVMNAVNFLDNMNGV